MTPTFHRAGWIAAAALTLAVAAAAQEAPANWSRGTTLHVFAGVASEPSAGRPMLGGAVGWQLTRTTAIEGSGSWINTSRGSEWFAGALKLQTSIVQVGDASPFVEAGVGLCRTSFDVSGSHIPMFYRRRMSDTGQRTLTRYTFTDPSVLFGGGISLRASRHIAIRPALEVTVVLRSPNALVSTAGMVRVAYHFEEHPVTPARKR